MKITRCIAAAAVMAAWSGAANAAAILYGVDNETDTLVAIDTVTGVVSTVGSTNPSTLPYYNYIGMTVGPDGTIYVTDQNSYGVQGGLATLDRTTGAETSRVDILLSGYYPIAQTGIAFDSDGTLYSVQNYSSGAALNILDKDTGALTVIDSLAAQIIGGNYPTTIAFSPDGVLFGMDNRHLISIDKTTGDVTEIGSNLADIYGNNLSMTFGDDGTLYVATRGINDYLLTLDPLTGAVLTSLLLSSTDSSLDLGGIAYFMEGDVNPPSEVPIPAAAFLFAPFAAGFMRLKRRKAS